MKISGFIFFLILMFCTNGVFGQDYTDLSNEEQLMVAADVGDSVHVQVLIRRGVAINAATIKGVTPLMFAAQSGRTNIVRLLITGGAKLNLRTYDGNSALMIAVLNGHLETAEYLLRQGVDLNLADNSQKTPLMHAIMADSFYMPDLLLYYDANVNLKDISGKNALMVASEYGSFEIAVRLLEAGADINSADNYGNTPLHFAVFAGHQELIELLILNGALLENKNSAGYTPLSLAIAENNYKAALALISYGADVNSRISQSLNPMTLAISNKNDSLQQLLQNHGAESLKRPHFDKITFGTGFTFNPDDSRVGFSFGMNDKRYHLIPAISYAFRPKAIQILEQTGPSEYYQYWERRHFISLSLDKSFFNQNINSAIHTSAFAGLSGSFTFGNYRGSKNKPDAGFLIHPRIGCIIDIDFMRVKFSYEYLDLRLKYYDNWWFNVGIDLLINRKVARIRIP